MSDRYSDTIDMTTGCGCGAVLVFLLTVIALFLAALPIAAVTAIVVWTLRAMGVVQ